MAEYTHPLWLGDPAEHGLYQDLIKVYRGEIKGKEARDTVIAARGEFPQQAFDMAKQEAIQRTDTPQGRISTYNSRVDFKKKAKQGKSWPMITTDGIQNAYIKDNKIHAPGSKFDGMKATEGNLRKAFVLPKDLNEIPANVDWNLLRDTNKSGKAMMDDIHGNNLNPINDYRFPEAKQVPEKLPNYGDLIPKMPETYREPTPINPKNIPFNPVLRPGVDPVYPNRMPDMSVQNRNNQSNNMLVKLATMQRLGLLG